MTTVYEWRGAFTNQEVNALHAEAFDTRVFEESEWNWVELTRHEQRIKLLALPNGPRASPSVH